MSPNPKKSLSGSMVTKECEVCGEMFSRKYRPSRQARFCGHACLHRWRAGQCYEKYIIPEEWLPRIKAVYDSGTGDGQITEIAKRIGVPRTKITHTAQKNGWIKVTRSKDWHTPWSERELEYISKSGHLAPKAVQQRLKAAGFERTISAIEVKRHQTRAYQNRKGMSANEVAQCLGKECHMVINLIKTGKLEATRRPGYTGPTAAWHIEDKALRAYIIQYLPEIDLRKVDKFWFVDILIGPTDR